MRNFNYSKIKDIKWDSEILSLVASIYRYQGKQELYLKQRPNELEKLIDIAKIQSTESSNEIEGIVTTSVRLKQLLEEKTKDQLKELKYKVTSNIGKKAGEIITILNGLMYNNKFNFTMADTSQKDNNNESDLKKLQ